MLLKVSQNVYLCVSLLTAENFSVTFYLLIFVCPFRVSMAGDLFYHKEFSDLIAWLLLLLMQIRILHLKSGDELEVLQWVSCCAALDVALDISSPPFFPSSVYNLSSLPPLLFWMSRKVTMPKVSFVS